MSTIQITCDNCGAKYKLPESFTSPKAKCQKCGSVIDVAGQRAHAESGDQAAAAQPAAAKPAAAARPAVDRSKQKPARAASGKAAAGGVKAGGAAGAAKAGGRASSRRRKGGDEIEHHAENRPGRGANKKNNAPMIFGGIGLVAIIVVVVFFMMQGDEKPADTDTNAQNPTADGGPASGSNPTDGNIPEDKMRNLIGDTAGDGKAGDGNIPIEAGNKAIGDEDPTEDPAKPAEASAPAPKLPKDAPQWMRMKAKTVADVPDPKTFGEVDWSLISAEDKEKTLTWAADFAGMGRAGRDAEAEMREKENRYVAVFGLVDHLRGLNYNDPFDTMTGYAINRFLTDITDGLQTGFVAAELDETIDPRKAEWNSKTVKTWLKFFPAYIDQAAFEKSCTERRKKANASK